MLSTLKSKLTSRKFWVAILGVIATVIGATTSTNETMQYALTISGAVISLVWLIVEGKCDWTAIKVAATTAITAVKTYEASKATTDTNTNESGVTSTETTVINALSNAFTSENIAALESLTTSLQTVLSAIKSDNTAAENTEATAQ